MWRGGWYGIWPGRGPFSYLPPWERPGWRFGRGFCWYYLWGPRYPGYIPYAYYAPYAYYPSMWGWW